MAPRGTATNLILQSGHLDVSPWAPPIGATASPYAGALPEGVDALVTLTDQGAAAHYVVQSVGVTTGVDVIVSGYARKIAGAGWMAVSIDGGATATYFDIGTGAVGNVSAGMTFAQVVQTEAAGVCRWSFKQKAPVGAATRVYAANGNAVAMGGFQVEVAVPGQTTPSPPIATGAATAWGRRDTRQGLLPWSDTFSDASFVKVRSSVALTAGGGSYDWAEDASASTTHELRLSGAGVDQPSAGAPAVIYVRAQREARDWIALFGNGGGSYACFDLSAGAVGTMSGARAIARGIAPAEDAPGWWDVWHAFVSDGTTPAIVMATADAGLSFSGSNGQVATRVARAQLAQTNTRPDYVRTRGGIWCPNGAPRLLAV